MRAVRSSIADPAARTGWPAAGDFLAFFVGRAADMVVIVVGMYFSGVSPAAIY